MKKSRMSAVISTMIVFASMLMIGSASAAGTNVSSGFSWTVGSSNTSLTEWSNYNSQGCGISISRDSNADGFDYRRETYNTSTNNGSITTGNIVGAYVGVAHNSTAGILSSSVGVSAGVSVASMNTDSWGETDVNGQYVQVSRQNGAYNREYGNFNANSGYEAQTESYSVTAYVSTYANTEFDY